MIRLVLFLLLTLILVTNSCKDESSDDYVRYTMKDGFSLVTTNAVKSYVTDTSFITNKNNMHSIPDNIIINQETKKDSMYGYSYVISLSWERAKFEKWIEQFGLQQDRLYFVETLKVVEIIPSTNDFAILEGIYKDNDKDSIGINSNTNKRGFVVSSYNQNDGYKAYSIVKRIAYDSDGELVNVYFPINPEYIKWKYFKIKTIW